MDIFAGADITIEDDVPLRAKVSGSTENHPANPTQRSAWLVGATATRLLGVTAGEKAVVAASAVAYKYVAACTIVGGLPAQVRKAIAAA